MEDPESEPSREITPLACAGPAPGEPAAMLERRLALVERLRRIEHEVARDEHARAAAALVRGRSHDLGNAIQIVRLASIEIERRAGPELVDLVHDLRRAAEEATSVLSELLAATHPAERTAPGPRVGPILRAALELARAAISPPLDLRVEVRPQVCTPCTAEELEAIAIAAVLEARDAGWISVLVRERVIAGVPWVELLRLDDRAGADLERPFAPDGGLHLVEQLAVRAGGEASLAPGRGGLELAVALPVIAA